MTDTAAGSRISLPEGAMCAVHAEAAARFACTRCGTFGCPDCRFGGTPPAGTVWAEVCRECAREGLPEPIAWERRKTLGWWRAFWDTTRAVCLDTRRFYNTPPLERGAGGAIFYGLVAYGAARVVLIVIVVLGLVLAGGIAGIVSEEPIVAGVVGGYGCLYIGLLPLIAGQLVAQALLELGIAAGAEHATLALMKRARVRFEETLRIVAYAYGPSVLFAIPGCGAPIAYLWSIGVEFVGLRETHRCGNDGAAAAVLGFRLLLLLLFVALYAAILIAVLLFAPGPDGGRLLDPQLEPGPDF